MIANVLKNRIREYAPANAVEQENVLQELMQHYVLASLSRRNLPQNYPWHERVFRRLGVSVEKRKSCLSME